MNKNSIITKKLLSIFFIIILIGTIIVIIPENTKALQPYYATVSINSTIDGELFNYPLKLNVFKNSGSNSAGNIYLNGHSTNWPFDICFKNNTGTIVAHWIELYNSTYAVFWFNATYIKSSGLTNYTINYGDGETYESNGSKVFCFFDDFSGDLSKWTIRQKGLTFNYVISDGIYRATTSASNYTNVQGNYLASATRATRFREMASGVGMSVGFESYTTTNNRQCNYGLGFLTSNDAGTTTNHGSRWTANVWHTFDITVISGTSSTLYVDNVPNDTHTTVGTTTIPPNMYHGSGTLSLDWYLVRNFTPHEPTFATPSTEQESEEEIILEWVDNSPLTECEEYTNYEYTFSTNYSESSFSIISNATWISIGSSNGTVYGKALHGIFYINVTAEYLTESIYFNYTLEVSDIILYWINYEPNEYGDNNTNYTYTFTVNLNNVTFSITTNATWLFIGSENGTIYGIAENGTYYVNVTATFEDEIIYYNYTLSIIVGEDMDELLILVWFILMLILLLISLKEPEWGILGGIVWVLAGLLEFIDLNTTLGLIIISIGMFIMLYGILELMKR